jgi:hypothetical protein
MALLVAFEWRNPVLQRQMVPAIKVQYRGCTNFGLETRLESNTPDTNAAFSQSCSFEFTHN